MGVVLIIVIVAVLLLKEGVDDSLHINKEEFAYLLQQGELPSTQEQITYPDFVHIILAEMRSYTNRKVMYAFVIDFNNPQGLPTEQLFALRMVTTNIERMSNRIKVANFPAPPLQYLCDPCRSRGKSRGGYEPSRGRVGGGDGRQGEEIVKMKKIGRQKWCHVEWMMRDVTFGGGLILSKREEMQGGHV